MGLVLIFLFKRGALIMLVIEVIPYRSFKEKIRLTKLYKKAKVIIYKTYIYVEYKIEEEF
ncbi:MAG: hypothetical protein K0S30_1708 [Clostridia bacterium]|nr:hypothetical protein [Clostridia bacterium]